MVNIVSPNGTILSDNVITMSSSSGNYVTTKKYQNTGKWYFEVTHLSGTEMFAVGFISQQGSRRIGFYPYKTSSSRKTSIFYSGGISSKWDNYGDLKLVTYSYGGTFGIGLDIDNMMFYIRSEYEIRIIEFETIQDSWSPVFFETSLPDHIDTISVNFGSHDFTYEPPFGFIPWESNTILVCSKPIFGFHISFTIHLFPFIIC